MGADNQAEKVIDRIERMERMQAEIERLNIRIRQDADKALQYLNEIDRLNELVAALREEKEKLYINVANRDAEIERLNEVIKTNNYAQDMTLRQAGAEVVRLNDRVATLVELRKFDQTEIDRLKALLRQPCDDAEFGMKP